MFGVHVSVYCVCMCVCVDKVMKKFLIQFYYMKFQIYTYMNQFNKIRLDW